MSIITRDIEYNLCKKQEINKKEYQQKEKEYEKSNKEKKCKKERKSRKKYGKVPLRDRQQWQFKGHKTSRK